MSACDELLRGFAWDRSLKLFDVLLMAAWAARNADLIWGESGGKDAGIGRGLRESGWKY